MTEDDTPSLEALARALSQPCPPEVGENLRRWVEQRTVGRDEPYEVRGLWRCEKCGGYWLHTHEDAGP